MEIDFPGEDASDFAKRYRVGGADAEGVRAVYTFSVRTSLAGTRNWIVEASEGCLAPTSAIGIGRRANCRDYWSGGLVTLCGD